MSDLFLVEKPSQSLSWRNFPIAANNSDVRLAQHNVRIPKYNVPIAIKLHILGEIE